MGTKTSSSNKSKKTTTKAKKASSAKRPAEPTERTPRVNSLRARLAAGETGIVVGPLKSAHVAHSRASQVRAMVKGLGLDLAVTVDASMSTITVG